MAGLSRRRFRPCHDVAAFYFFYSLFSRQPVDGLSFYPVKRGIIHQLSNEYMLDKILDIIMTILPFFGGRKKRRQMAQEVKEFSELVKEQYGFLMTQLEKVLKDYFYLSDRVKEMHTEIFSLKGRLSEAIALQCVNKECVQRKNSIDA